MRHIGRSAAHKELLETGTYGVEIAFFDEYARHMGAADSLAHSLVGQHLCLTDLVTKPFEFIHNFSKPCPPCFAEFFEFFLESCVIDIHPIAENVHRPIRIIGTESDARNDAQLTSCRAAAALIEFGHALHTVVVGNRYIAKSRSLCRFYDLLRGIPPIGKGRMDMQIACHVKSP